MDEQDLKTVGAMAEYGGSFAKALAYCFLVADEQNTVKLKAAFPAEWKQYEEMARKEEGEQENLAGAAQADVEAKAEAEFEYERGREFGGP